jgi:HK97 gp10 family phage protein
MTDSFKFSIEGIEEVKKMLEGIPKEITDKIQFDLNRAAAKIVEAELKASVPDGVSDKASADKAENNTMIARSNTKSGVYVGFSKRAWYVKLIERGTKVRQTLGKGKYIKGANRGSIERKPFIEAAYLRAAPVAVEYLSTNYLKLVEKAIKKQSIRITRKNLRG